MQVVVINQEWLMGVLACTGIGEDAGKADNVEGSDGHQGTQCKRKAAISQSL